jgi:hypothetical protein
MGMGLQIIAAALAALFGGPAPGQAAPVSAAPVLAPPPPICRRVSEQAFLRIDPDAAARLAEIGLDRAAIFERMAETSIPETMGCWAMPVGNFDSQLVSVGMSQWNYGTGSLQPVLKAWKKRLGGKFGRTRKALAPVYGKLLFSRACLKVPVKDKCREGILAAHKADGKLNPVILAELTAIFESACSRDSRSQCARYAGRSTPRCSRASSRRTRTSRDCGASWRRCPKPSVGTGCARSSRGTRHSREPSTRTG